MWKRFLLWDFKRGSWQYDVVVGLILAFIFVMPRGIFRDQPRIPKISSLASLPSGDGSVQFFLEPQFLENVAEDQRVQKVTELLRGENRDKHLRVIALEPILNSEGELQGYRAVARP
jgi:hypothetical protein